MESIELTAENRRTLTLGLLASGVVLSAAAVAHAWLQSAAVVVVLFLTLAAWPRFRLPGVIISFLVSLSLVQLLKRIIFLSGPQPAGIYYGVQFVPALLLAIIGLLVLPKLLRRTIPWSGRLLAAFLLLSLALTMLSARLLPWWAVLTAIHQQLLPLLLFFVGLAVPPAYIARLGRTMAILAGLSAVYGVLQFVGGPTAIDRAWSEAAYSYSIHAGKVFAYLSGASPDFRAYSFYADPMTWGLFLCAGFTGACLSRQMGSMSRFTWWVITLLVLAGLFCTLTRTVWAGFLATVGTYLALRYRPLRRPWLIFLFTLGSFALAVTAGSTLYREIFLGRRMPNTSNPIASRYFNVGTIEARISAWEKLREAVRQSSAVGQGNAVLLSAVRAGENREAGLESSHNYIVELVFNTGIPGACLFLLFFLQWLREAFQSLPRIQNRGLHGASRWVIAFTAGSFITGYLNGSSFMTYEFFMLMGIVAGTSARQRAAGPLPAKSYDREIRFLRGVQVNG
jgi:O-antigen ligase